MKLPQLSLRDSALAAAMFFLLAFAVALALFWNAAQGRPFDWFLSVNAAVVTVAVGATLTFLALLTMAAIADASRPRP